MDELERLLKNRVTDVVHAWIREDLDTGAKMLIGFHARKLIDRLLSPGERKEGASCTESARTGTLPVLTSTPCQSEERDLFETWAVADHRCVQPLDFEERTPDNGCYYAEESTNHAYIGWRERRALSTRTEAPAAGVAAPEGGGAGWVTVPREPTGEMVQAGFRHTDASEFTGAVDLAESVYRAMIQAAPQRAHQP